MTEIILRASSPVLPFKHSWDVHVLAPKHVALKQIGLGNKNNRADPFMEEEVSILFQKKLLGSGKLSDYGNLTLT